MRNRKLWTKTMTVLMTGAMIVSMSACGSNSTGSSADTTENTTDSLVVSNETETEAVNSITFSEDYSESSFTMMVTGIEDSTINGTIMNGGNMGQPGENSNMEQPGGNIDMSQQSTDGTTPPDMPSGDGTRQGNTDGTTPPDMPNGDSAQAGEGSADSSQAGDGNGMAKPDESGDMNPENGTGMAGDMSGGVTVAIVLKDTSVLADGLSFADITEGSFLTVELDSEGNITSISVADETAGGMGQPGDMGQSGTMGQPGGMGGSSAVTEYTAVNEFTDDATVSGETYESTGSDENAILVSSGDVSLSDITVTRNSSDSTGGDNSSFYGVGAAILATGGTLNIENADISTDSAGGAGVFSYGDSVVTVSDSTITTKQDTSGGIHAAGGGTLYANNLTVTTNGESSAAIRSDRGGGTMVVEGGSYTSNGIGSPAVYCTADISVSDASLTATSSEAVCIEGLNSLKLTDCDLTGSMQDSSQNDCTWNIIVYQSMSGDSQEGNGTFAMTGGSLTATNGGMFYTTNTESTFYLNGVEMNYSDTNDFLLMCTGNTNQRGWGTAGSNGADCTFTADVQELEGNVIYDSISQLDFYLENSSSLKGAFIDDETYAGNGGSGYAKLYIDASSTWTVTADSELSGLYCEGTVIGADGKSVTIVGTDGTVYVQGDGAYTVTVSEYSTSADMSGAYTEG